MTPDEQQTMQAKLDRLNAQIDKMIALAGHIGYAYHFNKWITVEVRSFERHEMANAIIGICHRLDKGTHFRTPLASLRTTPPTEYCEICMTDQYPDHMHSGSLCRDCHEAALQEQSEILDRYAEADRNEDEYPRWRHS